LLARQCVLLVVAQLYAQCQSAEHGLALVAPPDRIVVAQEGDQCPLTVVWLRWG
jgi:hypothetical protein